PESKRFSDVRLSTYSNNGAGVNSARNSSQMGGFRASTVISGGGDGTATEGVGTRPSTATSSKGWVGGNAPPGKRVLTPSLRNRPTSSASRTHVPSLTSHAFYRPMSSAKLQAQRGGQGVNEDETTTRQQQHQQA